MYYSPKTRIGRAKRSRKGSDSARILDVFTSFAGDLALLIVAIAIWKLIPRDLDIAEGGH